MQVDIAGRVENLPLPLTQPCIPLFECLVNSLEAIEEGGVTQGRIDVHIERDSVQADLLSGDDVLGAVRSIQVVDNGCGFGDINAKAFFVSDSTRKAARGNKGIGRFTWLKVFEKVDIDSTYCQGEEWHRRQFEFLKTQDGVENEVVSETLSRSQKTSVRLRNIRPEYQRHFPKSLETIAQKIIDHLVIYFLNPGCPQIWIHDDGGVPINVNQVFSQEATERAVERDFQVGCHKLKAYVIRFDSSLERHHTVSYCGHKREVIGWNLRTQVPDFKGKLVDADGQSFVFRTYVMGPYLDSRVDPARAYLMLAKDDELELGDELTRSMLDAAVINEIKVVASPYMEVVKAEKRRSIEQLVASKAPQYRFMLRDKYSPYIDQISPNLSDDQLDLELYKAQRDIELQHREEGKRIETLPQAGQSNEEAYRKLREQFLQEENELGQAALARYVVHRRTILELIDKALVFQEDGRYAKEEAIHSIIFPMRASSEDVDFDRQNLWVLDERLAYHWYLGSDLPINRLKVVNSDGRDEPDIVVFNVPKVFAETKRAFSSAVIVEFKRPERNEYPDDEENPVEQVIRYVQKLREGKAKSDEGATLNVPDSTPFYAYVVCSLTPRMKRIADTMDFLETPDRLGYFRFHNKINCYIEIMSYEKMVEDAKKRNRAFFEKLQIPMV